MDICGNCWDMQLIRSVSNAVFDFEIDDFHTLVWFVEALSFKLQSAKKMCQ